MTFENTQVLPTEANIHNSDYVPHYGESQDRTHCFKYGLYSSLQSVRK